MRVLFETLFDRFYDGWCIAARAYARAMERAGLEVYLHSWMPMFESRHPLVDAEVGHMIRPCSKPDLYIWSGTFGGANPEQVKALHRVINKRQLHKLPVMFYTMFERTNVQSSLVPLLNQLDGVIVPCSANLRSFERAGVKNAKFFPLPYFDDDPHLKIEREREPGVPRIYWCGRWEPRKAPHRLVRAFVRAFEPHEATLTLKVGPVPWTRTAYAPVEDAVGDAPHVRVVRELLSPEEMVRLHADHDVYASASRGEGIDLPSFCAKLSGNRVVTTACGGPEDFVSEGDVVVPATGEVPLPDYDTIWGEGSTSIDYDQDALVAALRQAARHSLTPKRDAGMLERHHYVNVGLDLRDWLESKVA